MIYENDLLRIEPFEHKHATAEYRSWFNDPIVCQHNSHAVFPYTETMMHDFTEKVLAGSTDRIIWAIIDKWAMEEHQHVGNISLQEIDWINRKAELAIIIGNKKIWGKGYGSDACHFVLHHAFHTLNLNKVWLGTAATNKGMIEMCNKLCNKQGMYYEGTLYQELFLNGNYVDIHRYGIFRECFKYKEDK